jgi:hypothetical protein
MAIDVSKIDKDKAPVWKRVKTPDGTEHHMLACGQHVATVFKEGEGDWVIRDLIKDNESNGWPTLAEAKDFSEDILE